MFLHSVHLRDVLSFRDTKVHLQKLNVLIGPNGSGKSNFIDVLSMLAGFREDAAAFFHQLRVGAFFYNAALVHHHEAVHGRNG